MWNNLQSVKTVLPGTAQGFKAIAQNHLSLRHPVWSSEERFKPGSHSEHETLFTSSRLDVSMENGCLTAFYFSGLLQKAEQSEKGTLIVIGGKPGPRPVTFGVQSLVAFFFSSPLLSFLYPYGVRVCPFKARV